MKRAFAVVFENGPGNLSAYAPDLPGCVSVGRSLEETRVMMKEAITSHIDFMREYGETVPEPRTSIPEALAIHNENLLELYEELGEDPPEQPATVELVEVDTSPDAIARDYSHLEVHDIRPSPKHSTVILGQTASG